MSIYIKKLVLVVLIAIHRENETISDYSSNFCASCQLFLMNCLETAQAMSDAFTKVIAISVFDK